jgi:hypothetical protein
MCNRFAMASRNYHGDVRAIVEDAEQRANECINRGDLEEAKRVVTDATRQIKDVKREIKQQERAVRESYQDARQSNAASGQTVGMFMSSKARASMARARAAQGRKIIAEKTQALRAFTEAYTYIDGVVAALDRDKAKVTDEIARRREGAKDHLGPSDPGSIREDAPLAQDRVTPLLAPPTPASNPIELPPPMWAPDPTRRHELRYWNGSAWTEHVASRGITAIDPPRQQL